MNNELSLKVFLYVHYIDYLEKHILIRIFTNHVAPESYLRRQWRYSIDFFSVLLILMVVIV